MRFLLALPAAVAIALVGPMAVMDTLQRQKPPGPGLGYWISRTALLSLGGLPVVAYVLALGSSLVRRRWRKAGRLVAGAGLAAIVIAAWMLGLDVLRTSWIEHHTWSGWYEVGYYGLYAVGALVLLSWPVRWMRRWLAQLARLRRAGLLAAGEISNLGSRV
jgi:hypothetical protein